MGCCDMHAIFHSINVVKCGVAFDRVFVMVVVFGVGGCYYKLNA